MIDINLEIDYWQDSKSFVFRIDKQTWMTEEEFLEFMNKKKKEIRNG